MTVVIVMTRWYPHGPNRVALTFNGAADMVSIVTLYGDVDVPFSALKDFVDEVVRESAFQRDLVREA